MQPRNDGAPEAGHTNELLRRQHRQPPTPSEATGQPKTTIGGDVFLLRRSSSQ